MQELEFVDNRRMLRLATLLLLAIGVLAAYVIISGLNRVPDTGGSDIHLPKIGARPPGNASQPVLRSFPDSQAQP